MHQNQRKQKRIAIVANATWNIYNFRLNVLQKLTEEDFDIFVIAPVDQFIKYKDSFPGITHISLNQLDRKSTNPIKEFRLLRELIKIYKRIQPDIILHYTVKPNLYGGIAAGFLGIPSVAVVTGLGYAFIHGGLIKSVTKYLYRFSSRFHRKIIFENTDDLQLFEQLKMIRIGQGISIKGCGVNVDTFSPYRSENQFRGTTFTFVGRLLYDKGIQEFVEAAKMVLSKIENVRFWIVGNFDTDNPAAVPVKEFHDWMIPDKIEYKGFQDDIRPIIAESDCIVLPSYREAIARALTEAMSMEKPVIATDTAGCVEAVDNGVNGYLVPVKDPDALAASFERFIQLAPVEKETLGKNGRIKVLREFDDTLIADQIFKILQGIDF